MKNTILIGGIIAIILIVIIAIGAAMVLDEKSKFIGTWKYSTGGTITFNNDNTVNIGNIGPLGDLELIGTLNYQIENQQVLFTAGSIGETLNYSFSDSNTLILSNNNGLSIILTKI